MQTNRSSSKLTYIIYTPPLDFKIGGVIALHNLAKDLRNLGFDARLFVTSKEKYDNIFCNVFADQDDVDDGAVVIYPEIIEGNPLNAKNVVRWMLCDIGIHGRPDIFTTWGKSDLLFHFSTFNDRYDPRFIESLYTIWIDPKLVNAGKARSGSCYLFKKAPKFHGDSLKMIHPKDAILIDNLSNDEIIEIFNQKEYFYCYDPYSFYDAMAALCGCIPIVYPLTGVEKIDWLKTKAIYQKYLGTGESLAGIAYGTDDIEYAKRTLRDVQKQQAEIQVFGKETVANFVKKTTTYFFGDKNTQVFKTVGVVSQHFHWNVQMTKSPANVSNGNGKVQALEEEIALMRASKFWKIRERYLGLKDIIKHPGKYTTRYFGWPTTCDVSTPVDGPRSLQEDQRAKNKKFKESPLAHQLLDGLRGLEIGGSAHNPFGLNTRNVDYTDDMSTMFKKEEVEICGEAMPVDIVAPGDKIPVPDASEDFVISSHVIEHFPDPIKALKEWYRIVKPGGYIFIIAHHKERTFDKDRQRTTLPELIERHKLGKIPEVDDHKHYSVWITEGFVELIEYLGWQIVAVQDVDDKVGNGFTVAIRK